MTKRSPDAQRLLDARQSAAAELKLEPSDWRVRRYALLALSIENIEAALATGEDLDTDALSKIAAQMQRIRDTLPPEKHQISVQFVEGCIGIYTCTHCGKRNDLEAGTYVPASSGHYEISGPNATKDSPTRGIEATANKPEGGVETPPKPKEAPQTSVVASKAVPEWPYHETAVKDSRPNAPANGGGGLCWFGTAPSKYPLTRER